MKMVPVSIPHDLCDLTTGLNALDLGLEAHETDR